MQRHHPRYSGLRPLPLSAASRVRPPSNLGGCLALLGHPRVDSQPRSINPHQWSPAWHSTGQLSQPGAQAVRALSVGSEPAGRVQLLLFIPPPHVKSATIALGWPLYGPLQTCSGKSGG